MEIVSGQPFYVLLANFRETLTEVPQHMLISIGDGTPRFVVQVTGEENNWVLGVV